MYIKRQLKKRLIISIISVMVLVVTIMSSSYALFMDVKSNVKDQVMTVGDLQITYLDNSGTISLLNVLPMTDANAMSQTDNVYEFTIDNTGALAYQFKIALANNPEFLQGGSKAIPANKMLPHEFIRYSFNGEEPKKLSDAEGGIVFEGTLNPHTARLYQLRIWIGSGDQNDPTNGLPNSVLGSEVHLNVNIDGRANSALLVQKIIDLGNIDEVNGVYKEPASDYRYAGVNPNNYVLFNDELWRIVGVFGENTHGVANQKLVKLYREEAVGTRKWDDNNSTNEWANSTLNDYLNNDYYNSIKPDYQEMIVSATWKQGGVNNSAITLALMYDAERSNTAYSGHATTSNGYIGLIYPSDYGYSAPEATCARDIALNAMNTPGCYNESWLFKKAQYTLTPSLLEKDLVWAINSLGNIEAADRTPGFNGYEIYPTLYLKGDVKLNSGNGTVSDPYILG